MTKNLCDNFEKWGNDPARTELHPRKKTKMTPCRLTLGSRRQSKDNASIATIPVHRQGNYPPEVVTAPDNYRKDYLDLKVGDGGSKGQGPNRWGAKRKVDTVTGTYSDHCERHLKEKLNESYFRRVLSNEMEVGQLVPFNLMRGHWASQHPTAAAPPKLNDMYGLQVCTEGGFLNRPLPCQAGKDLKSSYKAHISRSPSNILKLPKDMQGRWSSERYKSAQLKLIDIMHERRAQPGRPILRPVLREEARKHIGDTGLLDHLLKHMTDTVVSTGERFRRRHNAEGAMEYWLEDASLMEIRKAAGIEDPSWLPPQGWKPGDKVQGGLWEISRRMSSSEAAEMGQLKDTVEALKREMKYLFERLKDLKQMGTLQVVTLKDADRVTPSETDEAHLRPYDDLAEKIEKQQGEQITAAGSSNTLEWQLADVRKAISRMQSDVQCLLELLGSQHGHERVTSSRDSPQAECLGNEQPGSSLQSTGEEVLSATNVSETVHPSSSSRGVVNNAHFGEPSAREFASVNSATSSSTDADGPTTKEIYFVTGKPEGEAKMGESSVPSVPRVCPSPQDAASPVWLNLNTKSVIHATNTRWDLSHNDQQGISASTTNSPVQINFPGIVRTLAKDNCPVAAAMAGVFGSMQQGNRQHPTKGHNPNHVGTEFTTSEGLMFVDRIATSARNRDKCISGHHPKNFPARIGRVFGSASQARIMLEPSDNSSPSCHPGPPFSLALTLGSPVHSEIVDSIVKHR